MAESPVALIGKLTARRKWSVTAALAGAVLVAGLGAVITSEFANAVTSVQLHTAHPVAVPVAAMIVPSPLHISYQLATTPTESLSRPTTVAVTVQPGLE